MRKVTKTWKLWWMLFIHLLAIIGIIGLYAEYIVSVELHGFIQFLATVVVVATVSVFIANSIKLLNRILKSKKLW
jgi:hypothetical protein